MKVYSLMLFAGGAPEEQLELVCGDDAEALLACAAQLAGAEQTEAWDGARLVCRLSRPVRGR